MINIVVADDQNLVMEGVCGLLELNERFSIRAKVSDSSTLMTVLREIHPDILLLDIRMPKKSGLDILEEMAAESLNIPTLMLTTFDEHDLVKRSIELGAKGYLRKDIALKELNDAIEKVAVGGTWIQPAISQQIKDNVQTDAFIESSQTELTALQSLTDGELQVLRLIAAGFSNNEIAETLHKSPGRVRNIVTVILEKLNVRDRTQAALKGVEAGIL